MIRDLFGRMRPRRGASAFEFALLSPVVFAMVLGMLDYGWFFSRQARVTSALTAAVRAGSNVSPEFGEGPGKCDMCVETSAQYAADALGRMGISVNASQLRPDIQGINGTCALVFDASIEHVELVGFVEVPTAYKVKTVSLLLNVRDC